MDYWMDRKKQMDKKWMVRYLDRTNRWMVRRKDNTYENNIDGWMDGQKNI